MTPKELSISATKFANEQIEKIDTAKLSIYEALIIGFLGGANCLMEERIKELREERYHLSLKKESL